MFQRSRSEFSTTFAEWHPVMNMNRPRPKLGALATCLRLTFIVLLAGSVWVFFHRPGAKRDPFEGVHAANTFQTGQCTWYAFERAREFGWGIKFDLPYGRHAKDWPSRVQNGRITSMPTVGAIMVLDKWPGNPYGHVAYVESVASVHEWTVSHANMKIGENMGVLDGVQIRVAEVVRSGSNILIDKSGLPLRLRGFLIP